MRRRERYWTKRGGGREVGRKGRSSDGNKHTHKELQIEKGDCKEGGGFTGGWGASPPAPGLLENIVKVVPKLCCRPNCGA